MALEESCSIVSNLQLCHSKQRKRLCHHHQTLSLFPMKEDIISRFPDDVLCHILSFLLMEDVVRTSLLSKRWSSVWTSVRCIDIFDSQPYAYRNLHKKKNKGYFVDFVDRVLRFSDMFFLQKLRIECSQHYQVSHVHEWVIAVTSRIVEHLDLAFYPYHVIKPPPSFFTCNKLMVLKLRHGFHLDIPTPVFLPSLKILHLFGLSLFNDASMNLLEGSPVLEDLDINSCSYVEMKTLFIRSSSLKSLRVNNHNRYRDAIGIIVDATNLKRLNLASDMIEQCDMNNSSSLIEVKLNIYPLRETIRVDGDKIVELLRSTMSNIKCMHLSHRTMKFLGGAHLNSLPMFHNLTRLELEIDKNGWQVLPYLLECSPNLLTFVLKCVSYYEDQHEWHQQYRKPKCLMLYLQEIELTEFKVSTHMMELVSYFLKNATNLKEMVISLYSCSKKEEIVRKLLMFPRSSSHVKSIFPQGLHNEELDGTCL